MAPNWYTSSSSVNIHNERPSSRVYGEPHKCDPSFRGPVQRRSCTDVICCVIFVTVILSYVALGVVAWLHGDPKKVLYPTNSYGQFCGQEGTSNSKKPILLYFNIFKCTNPVALISLQCPTTQMCVSECPDRFATYSEMQLQYKVNRSYWEYYRQFCKPGFNNPDKPVSHVLRDDDCPSMIIPSRPFFQRCLPDVSILNGTVTAVNSTGFNKVLQMTHNVTELQNAAKSIARLMDTKDLGMMIAEDYAKSWRWILIGLLLSMVVSLVFILLLRFTAGLLLWITIISVVLLLAYGMCYCFTELSQLRHRPGSEVTIIEVGLHTDLQVYLQLTQTWIIMMVSLGVTEASILMMLMFLRRRIRVAVALLRETSKAIGHIMSTLFYPLITFLWLIVCISYWAITAAYRFNQLCEISNLASMGESIYKVVSPDVNCPYANSTCIPEAFNRTNISKYAVCQGSQCLFAFYGGETSCHHYLFLLQLFNLLVFLWVVNFTLALQQCSLAGAFASYYWAEKKPEDIPPCPLFTSFIRAIRYHTGSLAFGALIISVAQLVRLILQYLEQKLKGLDSSLSRFITHCLKCCFWCLEKLIRYVSHNAYIMMAIYGKNFCTSAREAFFLLMRNVVRVVVLDRVTDFLLFLSKALISGGIGAIVFFFLTRRIPTVQEELPNLNYYCVPLLTVVAGSHLIAHVFFSIYTTCIDTLFLCLCDELERTSNKTRLVSSELHNILTKSIRVS